MTENDALQLVWDAEAYPDAPSQRTRQEGLEFRDFVMQQLALRGLVMSNYASMKYQYGHGENVQGWEIKEDKRCTDTGRLSIEVGEKTRADPALRWTPSGILRNDNAWLYLQGNRKILFIFAKNFLREWYENKKPELTEKFGTALTFYMPMDTARRWAAKVIEFDAP